MFPRQMGGALCSYVAPEYMKPFGWFMGKLMAETLYSMFRWCFAEGAFQFKPMMCGTLDVGMQLCTMLGIVVLNKGCYCFRGNSVEANESHRKR